MVKKDFMLYLEKYQEILNIGKKLKDARIKAGMTQYQVAKKIGVKQQMISQIEKGKHSPSIKTLIKVANAFSKQIIIKLADGDIITKNKDDIDIKHYLEEYWKSISLKLENSNKINNNLLTIAEINLNRLFSSKAIYNLSDNKELASIIYLMGVYDAFNALTI